MDDPIRIVILLMIKNESQIIRRSIDSTIGFADGICVEDTGSTDDTVTVMEEHFKSLKIPTKLVKHPWKNFGASRSHSFLSAVEFCKDLKWDLQRTYILAIDADMNLVVNPQFKKEALKQPGYQITQVNGTMEYVNIRFLRADIPWTCKGATHEHWAAPPDTRIDIIDKKLIYIDDKNDGGCKADKFQRDRDLLEEELKEQPDNPRTVFYLAQTYKCLGELKKSIEFYKKRIQIGGWFEEVWYSHYMIAQNYMRLEAPEKMELWVQRAQKFKNYRAEALVMLVSHLRTKPDQQYKAFHYLQQAMKIQKPASALFSESDTYDYKIDFEYTILQYYTNSNRKEGLMVSIKYLLKDTLASTKDVVFNNLGFYMEPCAKTHFELGAPPVGDFVPSSSSIVTLSDGSRLLNIRYVNYSINKSNGSYIIRDQQNKVRTRNAFLKFKGSLTDQTLKQSLTFMQDETPEGLVSRDSHILGLEDVRVFQHNNTTYYVGTSLEFSPKIRMVLGEYNIDTQQYMNSKVLEPPAPTDCEKNWLPLTTHKKQLLFLFNYYPLQVGIITDKNIFKPLIIHKTPDFFQNLRGSASPILYDNKLFVLVHFVKHSMPRNYFHQLLVLDPETFKPMFLSNPFYFQEIGIEYCIGFSIENDTVEYIYSSWDSNPHVTTVPLDNYMFVPV